MSNQPLVSLLADLVRINSVNCAYPNGPGEAEMANFVEAYLRRHGIDVERQRVFPSTDANQARDNVIGTLPGRLQDKSLILEAHMDTVSTVGMTIPPWEPKIDSGRMYGRGSVDTKAGLAAMLYAMVDTARSRREPPCQVRFAAVVDEEHAFTGVTHLLTRYAADGAVVAEPTEMKIVVASKGVLRWRIIARGKAAHSAKAHLGINAIEHMAQLIVNLEPLHQSLRDKTHTLLGSPTANIGTIQGGIQVNVVPDECVIEIDRRLIPGDNVEAIFASYQEAIDQFMLRDPRVDLRMEPPMLVDAPFETSQDEAIVQSARTVHRRLGIDDRCYGVPYGSDASKFSRAGIPCILFGPGSIDQAHTVDEYVAIEQVECAFEFYRSLIHSFEG